MNKKLYAVLSLLIGLNTLQINFAQYCNPVYSSACSSGDFINNFSTTGGISNITNNASGCSSGNYQYFTQTVSQNQGGSINISVQSGPSWGQGFRIWVDWNQDGDFVDAGEDVWNSGTSGTGVFTGSVTVPMTAIPGITRMRVRCQYAAVPADPCALVSYGEAEDYDFNVIALTPCSAPPTAGTVVASSNPVCPSAIINLSLSGSSTGSGLTYQWQSSPTGNPGTFVNIPGATNASYSTSFTSNAYVRAYLTCSGQSDTSAALLINVNPHYTCYCASAATSTADEYVDTVRIGDFVNQSFGLCSGYQNFTSLPTPTLFKSVSYSSAISTRDCEGSGFYSRYVEVYIDYNQDGIYQDPAEVVLSGSLPGAIQNSITGNITIPLSALTGVTGMRVVCREFGSAATTQPCGTYTWGETEDYLVDIRPLPNEDAGIAAILSPTQAPSTSCNVDDTLIVVLTTQGQNPLTSADIVVEVNGSIVTTYSWTGTLTSGQTDIVNIGFVNFNDGDILKVWATNPNGNTDEFDGNDTVNLVVYNALSGIYTIGGTSPNFNTIADAVNALMTRGICNDVIFNIRPGLYNEQVSISQYPIIGSANYRVTFQSESLNANDVIVDFAPSSSASNYLFDFNGADNVTLNRLTLRNTSFFSTTVRLGNGANNIIIENNQIIGDTLAAAVDANKHTINSTAGNDNNLIIRNNTIRGGSRAIWLFGENTSSYESGLKINENIITDYYQAGLVLVYQIRPEVSKNNIFSDTTNGIGNIFHLDIEQAINGAVITGNYVNGRQAGFGINLVNIDANASNPTLVANNMVYMGSVINGTYSEAIALQDVTNTNVVFNSAHVLSANNETAALRLFNGSSSGINIWNNNLVNSGTGVAVNAENRAYINASNYNNLFVAGSNVSIEGTTSFASITDWLNATGFDGNSLSVNPNFTGEDLHTCRAELDGAGIPVIGVTNDFDNDPRSASTPDIGADEFISTANFTLGPDIIKCTNDTITLSAPFINGATYNWSPFFQTTPTITTNLPATYFVQVVSGCGLATDTVIVTNYPSATASFTSTNSFFSVMFNNTSTNGVTYSWDFGDGNTSNDINPTHVYANEGTYTVVLTVTDQCGNTATASQVITIDVQFNSLDEEAIQQLNVYPNPTEGEVYVQFAFDGIKDIHIRMVDLAGRIVYSRNMGTHVGLFSSVFDLSGQPAGTYMMIIQAGEYTKVQRIVVK